MENAPSQAPFVAEHIFAILTLENIASSFMVVEVVRHNNCLCFSHHILIDSASPHMRNEYFEILTLLKKGGRDR